MHSTQQLLQDLLTGGLIRQEDWDAMPAWQHNRLTGAADTNRLLDQLLTLELLTGYQAGRIRARKPQWLVLGEYRVLDRLGAGSLGVVFKAEHLHTREPAAIKVLVPPATRQTSPLVGLLAECQTVAHLHHPNIIRVLDVGEAHSEDPDCPVVYYYVMEYVTGTDLEKRVQGEGPLPVVKACELAYQVASALAAAHEHQLTHRDLKPSNVLLTESGQAKLLDFGLARSFREAVGQSEAPPSRADFLAPEQLDSSAADVRTDLYSLGATLFWALTGRVPFAVDGDWKESLTNRANLIVPVLKSLGVQAPDALQTLLEKLLAFRPEDRLATPLAVMQALAPLRPENLREEPITLPEPRLQPVAIASGPVLLVDADDDSRALCKAALAEEGVAADDAATGKRGLELALAGHHDVIVVAADLADLEGVELVRYLRQKAARPHVRILGLCADLAPEAIGQVLAAGADDYLLKPVDPLQFRTRVKMALHIKQTQDQQDVAIPAPVVERAAPPPPRLKRLLRPLGWLFGA